MTFLRGMVLDSLVRKGLIGTENEGLLAFCLPWKKFASVYTILLILRNTFLAWGTHGHFARHLGNCLGLALEATSSGQHEAKSVGIRFPLSGMWRNCHMAGVSRSASFPHSPYTWQNLSVGDGGLVCRQWLYYCYYWFLWYLWEKQKDWSMSMNLAIYAL